MFYSKPVLFALLIAACPALPVRFAVALTYPFIEWQSPAQLRQPLKRAVKGTLLFDNGGVEFRGPKLLQRWPYGEIKTFELSGTRELILTDYGNRHWHEPGERTFRFTLSQPMPPSIAAAFTARVRR